MQQAAAELPTSYKLLTPTAALQISVLAPPPPSLVPSAAAPAWPSVARSQVHRHPSDPSSRFISFRNCLCSPSGLPASQALPRPRPRANANRAQRCPRLRGQGGPPEGWGAAINTRRGCRAGVLRSAHGRRLSCLRRVVVDVARTYSRLGAHFAAAASAAESARVIRGPPGCVGRRGGWRGELPPLSASPEAREGAGHLAALEDVEARERRANGSRPRHHEVARDVLERLVHYDHREGEPEHRLPLRQVEGRHGEDGRQEGHVDDHQVQPRGDGYGGKQPGVGPRVGGEEGVVLGEGVERVEHLHQHQDGHGDGGGAAVLEHRAAIGHLALDAVLEVGELRPGDARPALVPQVPPRVPADGDHADVEADDEVAHEHPGVDDGLVELARPHCHDVRVRLVEAQRRRGEAVRHQVDPKELHGHEGLGHADGGGEEDAHHLADVGGDHVADELLGVGEDGAALSHRLHDGGEVVVGQHHVRSALRHRRAAAHRHADVRLLERGGVVHPVARHGHHVPLRLEQVHQAALVRGLHTAEHHHVGHGHRLLRLRQAVELEAGVRLGGPDGLVELVEHADAAAHRLGRRLGVARHHDDADPRRAAHLYRAAHLLAGRVEHPGEADEGEPALVLHPDVLGGARHGPHRQRHRAQRLLAA
eukprot:1188193-Prorocentrum_minimum.AAC.2